MMNKNIGDNLDVIEVDEEAFAVYWRVETQAQADAEIYEEKWTGVH